MVAGLLQFWAQEFASISARYFLFGAGFALFYSQAVRDNWLRILLSLQSFAIYAVFGWLLYFIQLRFDYSPVYTNVDEHGWFYFFFWIIGMTVYVDAAFYWVHRLMHGRPIFVFVHKLHHRFVDVTPWASYGLHFNEAALVAVTTLYIPALLFPWHPAALLIYSTYNIGWTTYLHCGYELIPEKWQRSGPLSWLYSSRHHKLHHQNGQYNFGIYFIFWDRLMGTEKENQKEQAA